ncbi:MAG: hypothetical protein R6T85_00155, partial [Egibacteraceae bacterium]
PRRRDIARRTRLMASLTETLHARRTRDRAASVARRPARRRAPITRACRDDDERDDPAPRPARL